MLLLNLPVLSTLDSFGKALHLFLYMCFTMVCIAGITDIIPRRKARQIARRFIIAISLLLFITNVYFAYYYNGLPDQAIMEVLIATSPEEAWGYVKSNLLNVHLFLAIAVCIVLFYIIVSRLHRLKNPRYLLPAMSILLTFASLFTVGNMVKDVFKHKNKTVKSLAYNCCAMIRTGAHFYEGWENLKYFERMLNDRNSHPKLLHNNSSIPYVVFILGESTSRHHLGLYGYHLNTTPCLSKREKAGELFKFTDVISPNGQTMPVLGKLFTFFRQQAIGKWFQYGDLFSILNEAGYHTVWISNQESSGIYGNTGRVYAERCHEKDFTRYRSSTYSSINAPYDEALLPLLDKHLAGSKQKNFFVVHMMGTHLAYKSRYPETCESFRADDAYGENDDIKQVKSEYDTAVRYNDSIINEIIKRFENRNAIVVYVSDHGEDVMEINKKIAGHGDIDINRRMVEIPMVVYASGKFGRTYPQLTQRIRQSAGRPFMTDDMIHMLLDLLDIRTKEYQPQLSVINSRYDASRIRYFGKNVYRKN